MGKVHHCTHTYVKTLPYTLFFIYVDQQFSTTLFATAHNINLKL